MANLTISENKFQQTFTITTAVGARLQLSTSGTYNNKDIDVTFTPQIGSVSPQATVITTSPVISVSSNGVISAANSATGITSSVVNPGWVDSVSNGNVYISGTALYTMDLGHLNVGGATVEAVAGYYPNNVSATIATGQVKTPATSISLTPSINNTVTSTGYVVSVSAVQSITPIVTTAGYITNEDAIAGNIVISGAATIAASTLSSSTVTPHPTNLQSVTIGAGYYPSQRTITINAMSSGTKANVSSEGSVTTTPSVTIGGDTNMVTSSSAVYYFTRTGVANNGVVQTKYKNTQAGYLNSFSATASGTVTVTPSKTADATIYIPTATITPSFSGGALNVSATQNNIELAETNEDNNGVKVTLNSNRAATSLTNTITAGYIAASNPTASYAASSTSKDYYVKGITLQKPTSGTSTFYLTFPNGTNDTITFHFEIDASGNVTIS